MSVVVDFYGPHTPEAYTCLKANGVDGIARYLTASPSDPREITPEEVAAAFAAGLEVHLVFELNPVSAGYFSWAQGESDAREAMKRLDEIGAPLGVVVYFTVDAPAGVIPPDILGEYFTAVERTAGDRLTPGIYGYEAHVEYARANFPAVGRHLWQTYGTPRGPLDLWQHFQTEMCGFDVDINDCSIKGWSEMGLTKEEVRAEIADYLANVYGPALETELVQRLGEAKQEAVAGAIAAALKAASQKLAA